MGRTPEKGNNPPRVFQRKDVGPCVVIYNPYEINDAWKSMQAIRRGDATSWHYSKMESFMRMMKSV